MSTGQLFVVHRALLEPDAAHGLETRAILSKDVGSRSETRYSGSGNKTQRPEPKKKGPCDNYSYQTRCRMIAIFTTELVLRCYFSMRARQA